MHLAQKYRIKCSCGDQYSLGNFQPICPTVHLQRDASPEPLQILTALIHRELPAVDGEHLGSVKKLAISNIKRFLHHRGKDEIRQNAETQFWNGLISEFAHGVAIKVLELISEKIWHLGRKKSTGVPDFIGDGRIGLMVQGLSV
jgi:hypothetical protein